MNGLNCPIDKTNLEKLIAEGGEETPLYRCSDKEKGLDVFELIFTDTGKRALKCVISPKGHVGKIFPIE